MAPSAATQHKFAPEKTKFSELQPLERMDIEMRGSSLSHTTRRQYKAIATRFEDFSVGEAYWTHPTPDYQQLTTAITAWFEQLKLDAPATVATYRSALARYASAAGYEINLAALVASPKRHRGNTGSVKHLTDKQLAQMRLEAAESPAIRSALELALAGLTIGEIATVTASNLTATSKLTVGKVTLVNEREIELFDSIGVEWLTGEGRTTLPIGEKLSEEAIRKRLNRLVYRASRTNGGLRELRITGVRRAIAIGIPRKRIADSLDLRANDRWADFKRSPSKQPRSSFDPIPADPARGRKYAEMSKEEFDRLIGIEEEP